MTRARLSAPAAKAFHVRLTGGNGSPEEETASQRMARLEVFLERLQSAMEIQFLRIAEMQGQLDRAVADRPVK